MAALVLAMNDVRYKIMPAMGAGEGPWEYAPLDEFILSIPGFVYALKFFGIIPPIHVLNEVLESGCDDAGMGGGAKWKPFSLSETEYEELVENLITNPNHEIREDRSLWEKPNYEKWQMSLLGKKPRGK
ncbi:hypothetical protein SAMN02745866_04294 [Alteromonadaceae bacterium Bs31]|nr:hypothetical protein SAMN02745866_04294 [Alteromonadaceae bacterium Bs31]